MDLMDIIQMSTRDLARYLEKKASVSGKKSWLFLPKNYKNKVCLVAHIDTVHDDSYSSKFYKDKKYASFKDYRPSSTKCVFHDTTKNVMWSPQGLGADDRAGVYACLKLWEEIPEPFKPIILFTDEEETGGGGAKEAGRIFSGYLDSISFFLELDRKGSQDCVAYNSGVTKEFIAYICKFGFKESSGSFSDIFFLCDAVEKCGVNLSIGYYNQHSEREYLEVNEMNNTIDIVKEIIIDAFNSKKQWEYEKVVSRYNDIFDDMYRDRPSLSNVYCFTCGHTLSLFEEEMGTCFVCDTDLEKELDDVICESCNSLIPSKELMGDCCPFCYSSLDCEDAEIEFFGEGI